VDQSEAPKMNIYQRINAVKQLIAYVRKDKKVESYMAVTHDAVTAETRDHFISQGVLIVPCELKSEMKDTGTQTGKGAPWMRFEATYRVSFVNIDQPSEQVSVDLTAHALDYGDKAPGKAHSYAIKYAVLKILQLETGEEEEGRDVDRKKMDKKEEKKSHSPSDGAVAALTPELQARAHRVANSVLDLWADEKPFAAYEQVYASGHDGEVIMAIWEILRPHSEIRSAIKKMHTEANKQPEAVA
jgi:hypothetical protein